MKLIHIGASLLLTSIFLAIAVDPWAPSMESLIVEEAIVKAIKPNGFASTRAEFSTSREKQVACITTQKSSNLGCPIGELRQLMQRGVPLKIWHDNNKVYRAELNSRFILDSSPTLNDRVFFWGLAFLCSIPLWIAFGRRVGLVNPAMKPEMYIPIPPQKRFHQNEPVNKKHGTE